MSKVQVQVKFIPEACPLPSPDLMGMTQIDLEEAEATKATETVAAAKDVMHMTAFRTQVIF